MRKSGARARILRIGLCGSEQKRGYVAGTADHPVKGHKGVLRQDHSFWHSTSMHSVRWVRTLHRKSDGNYRARAGEIVVSETPKSPKRGVLPSAAALVKCFLFFLSKALIREAAHRLFQLDVFQLRAASACNVFGRFSFLE
jgi:hypothetical protein